MSRVFWVILNRPFTTEKEAREFKRVMHEENGINKYALFVRQDKSGGWRVVRRMTDWHLRDPILGNRKQVEQYRQHLIDETRRAKKKIRGKL